MKKIKNRYIRITIVGFSTMLAVVGLISGVVTVLDSMGVQHVFKNGGHWALVCFGLITVITGLIAVVINLLMEKEQVTNIEDGFKDKNLDALLITLIEKSLDHSLSNKEYTEVFRLGTVLSRPLWLSGKYRARIQIGKLVEEAAALVGKKSEQAQALIDDIGWTNAEVGNYDEAVKNIKHGNDIAKSVNNNYLLAKGLRHLGGISKRHKQFDEAVKYYADSIEAAKNITDAKESKEMIAGVEFALGSLKIEQKDFITAEKHIETALKLFRELKDTERTIKTISINANLHLEKGETEKAKDMFREGLKLSRDHDRKDQIVFNLMGLSKIHYLENNTDKALELKNEADILAKAIGIKINH